MEHSLQRQLVLTAKGLRADFDARLGRAGSSLAAWAVLRLLVDEDGLSQRELAGRLGIEAPTLTRHLDRMVEDGLVSRRRDDSDRRVVHIDITAPGRQLYRRLRSVAEVAEADFRSLMSEREAATLGRVLDRIASHLEERRGDTDR